MYVHCYFSKFTKFSKLHQRKLGLYLSLESFTPPALLMTRLTTRTRQLIRYLILDSKKNNFIRKISMIKMSKLFVYRYVQKLEFNFTKIMKNWLLNSVVRNK